MEDNNNALKKDVANSAMNSQFLVGTLAVEEEGNRHYLLQKQQQRAFVIGK